MRQVKPLGKRELKYKETAQEGMEQDSTRKKFIGSQKSGIPTSKRVMDLLRSRQGFSSRRGTDEGPRRTMTPMYSGPDQHVEKGNVGDENT